MEAPIQPVRETLEKHLPNFDHAAIEAMLGTVVANWDSGPSVWLELIAPSSMGKTAILMPLEGIRGAVILSKLTSKTLLSGAKIAGGKDPSLLAQLGPRPFIVIKELSQLLTGDPHTRAEIFAQFREVGDGMIERSWGTGVTRIWRGKATLLVGITPAVDLYSTFDAHLGERFLKLRFDSIIDPEELALSAWDRVGDEDDMNTALNAAYQIAINGGILNLANVELSRSTIKKIAAIASLTAAMRTPVTRDRYRRDEVQLPPTPEGTPRIMKALGLLAKGLAALHGTTDLEDLSVLHRVAFDCMPEPRRSVFKKVVAATEPLFRKEMNGIVSGSNVYRVVKDLSLLGVVTLTESKPDGKGRPPDLVSLSDTARGWLSRAGYQ